MSNLWVDDGEKATGKHMWVGCKAYPCAKQPHYKGKTYTSSSGPAVEGEHFPHSRSRHQLGISGRQKNCDGRVTSPTTIVHYLSELWFI